MGDGTGPYRVISNPDLREDYFSASAVQPNHIEAIRRWRNAQLKILRQPRPISSPEQVAYFDREIWPDKLVDHPRNVILVFQSKKEIIGYGGLVHISWLDARAEVSFLLDPGRNIGPAEYRNTFGAWLLLMKKLAFDDLGLRRLTTETYITRSENLPILEQAAFVKEGVLRDQVLIDEVYVDSILHGCIKE